MLIMGVWYASPLAEVAGYAALAGLIALTVALWVKGSRLPQLLEIAWVRGLGLIAMVVCVPSVILFSFITIFGVG